MASIFPNRRILETENPVAYYLETSTHYIAA